MPYIQDGELGKILTPSLEELCCLKRVILIFTIIVLSIDWLVIFSVATNGKILIQVIHQIVVLLIVMITMMMNVLKAALFDFKLYRPNLITNDGYINHYQKVHRDFKI